MQQAILYFPIRKYRFMLEVLASSWNFIAHFWNYVLFFLAQKTVFSALSAHKLKQTKNPQNLALKGGCMRSVKLNRQSFPE